MTADFDRPATGNPLGVWTGKPVAAELEGIFLDATGLPSGPPVVRKKGGEVRALNGGRVSRSKTGPATLGALAAMGLAGLGVGVVLVHGPQTPAPVQIAPPPAVAVAVADASRAAPAAPQVQQVALPAHRPLRKLHATRAGSRACAQGCSHPDLLVADRRLRAAYYRAVDAGVSRPILIAYRNRWASLRHDAVYQPARVASGYGAMAGDLNRLANRQRGRHPARSRFRLWS